MPLTFLPDGFWCHTCKEFHSGLPISYAADFPDSYACLKETERATRAEISSDQCIINNEWFFIRGLIEIPIIGFEDFFLWGVWASVKKETFDQISDHWETPGRENLIGPYKGRINNSLSEYPETLNLKCTIHIRPAGERPVFCIDEPDHPLAKEQREGMTLDRIQEIASHLMHKQS